MLSYFDAVKDYMNDEKCSALYKCIRETEDEATINLLVKKFYIDLDYLVNKIKRVIDFNSYQIKGNELSKLEEHLKSLIIDISPLDIFNNELTKSVVTQINDRIKIIIDETEEIKIPRSRAARYERFLLLEQF